MSNTQGARDKYGDRPVSGRRGARADRCRSGQGRARSRQGNQQGAAPEGHGRALVASALRLAFPFVVTALVWQAFALWGPFPPKLFPGVDKIAATFVRLLLNGVLVIHALGTIARLVAGFAIGGVLGVALGLAMGRSRRAEELLLPIVSVGNPVPGSPGGPSSISGFGGARRPARLPAASPARFRGWSRTGAG